jgi:hypothetical protein
MRTKRERKGVFARAAAGQDADIEIELATLGYCGAGLL